MKSIIFFLINFIVLSVYSQNFEDKLKADICACFEDKMQSRNTSENAYMTCFKEKLPPYAMLIDAGIEEENQILRYQKGQQLRKTLSDRLQYELVYSCDIYFNMLEAERERQFASKRSNTYPADLEKLNQQVAMQPHSYMYLNRAQTHFYLGNLKEAEDDVLYSMKINPVGQQGSVYITKEKILLGSILEKQERYNEAAILYKEIYTLLPHVQISVLHAIVTRKSGGVASKLAPSGTTQNESLQKRSRVIKQGNSASKSKKKTDVNQSRESRTSRRRDSKEQPIKATDESKQKGTEKGNLRNLFKLKKKDSTNRKNDR